MSVASRRLLGLTRSQGNGSFIQITEAPLNPAHYLASGVDPAADATVTTAGWTAAFAALPANGGELFFVGTHLINPDVLTTGTKVVKIRGAGSGTDRFLGGAAPSRLQVNSATGVGLTLAAHGCEARDFAIQNINGTLPTAGSGVAITAGDRTNIMGVLVSGFYDCIDFQDGGHWAVGDGTYIADPVRYGLRITHPAATDSGDQFVQANIVTLTRSCTAGIHWESGGGPKIIGTKIVGGATYKPQFGIDAAVADGVNTSILIVNGSSIENVSSRGLFVRQLGTTGNFGKIIVTGNEFSSSVNEMVAITGASGHLFGQVVVASNSIDSCLEGILLRYAQYAVIGPNSHGTAYTSTNAGVHIDTGCNRVNVYRQQTNGGAMAAFATGLTNLYIQDLPFTTATRPGPTMMSAGSTYFDQTLNKPGWADGTNWRDAAANII